MGVTLFCHYCFQVLGVIFPSERLRQLLADLDARTRSLWGFYLMLYGNMEVSISGGTLKWMVYSGKSIYKC